MKKVPKSPRTEAMPQHTSPPQVDRLCLKWGSFSQSLAFKVILKGAQHWVRPYSLIETDTTHQKVENSAQSPSKTTPTSPPTPILKQRYNYDLILQKIQAETEMVIEAYVQDKLVGHGKVKVGGPKIGIDAAEMQIYAVNQATKQQPSARSTSPLKGSSPKTVLGTLSYSLTRIDRRQKGSHLRIEILSGQLSEDSSNAKLQPYVVVKYGELNFKTRSADGNPTTPYWGERFTAAASQVDRFLVQVWRQGQNVMEFVGLASVSLGKVGEACDYEVINEKAKVGSIRVRLSENGPEEQSIPNEKVVRKRTLTIYVVEAVVKKPAVPSIGWHIKLILTRQFQDMQEMEHRGETDHSIGEYKTTMVFSSSTGLIWNQSFIHQGISTDHQPLRVELWKSEKSAQQMEASGTLDISSVENKKYQVPIKDETGLEQGVVYLDFYDQGLDIKQEVPSSPVKAQNSYQQPPKAQKLPNEVSLKKQVPLPTKQVAPSPLPVKQSTQQRPPAKNSFGNSSAKNPAASEVLMQTTQIKARYTPQPAAIGSLGLPPGTKLSLHDYMAQLDGVLQEGLVKITKQRPTDPVKQLGLFLINYRK